MLDKRGPRIQSDSASYVVSVSHSSRALLMGQPGWTGRSLSVLFRLQCCGASRPIFPSRV